MKTNSLAQNNPYLKAPSSDKWMAQNIATSTSIETGKPSSTYIKRCIKTGKLVKNK